MGYRSDIKMVITTTDKKGNVKKLMGLLDPEAIKEFKKYKDIFKLDIYTEKGFGRIRFSADYVKGYSDFKEVELFEKGLNRLIEIADKIPAEIGLHFVRMGEDMSDTDERIAGDPVEGINISRYIEFDDE